MSDEKIDTDTWTQNQKDQIMRTLMKERIGGLELDEEKGLGLLSFEQEIPARVLGTVQVPCYLMFKPKRLIIFETTMETVTHEDVIQWADVTRGHLWWKKTTRERVRHDSTPRLFAHKVSRSSFSIVGGFVGQQSIWPSMAAQPGDAFGLDNALCFDGPTCTPGLTITLNVRNNTDEPLVFTAVMVGKYITEQTRERKPFSKEITTS